MNSSELTTDPLPLRMLHDRILVALDKEIAERRSSSGIVIPATAALGKRLSWGTVVSAGPNVRHIGVGDKVLFDPENHAEVDIASRDYLVLRERDIHAVAEPEEQGTSMGLYL